MLFFPVVVWVLVVFHQGLFQLCNQGSDLLTLGRPGRMTEKDTDPSLNRVLYESLSLLYGLRTVVHVFHGIWFSSASIRYFVGVSCLPKKETIIDYVFS